VIDEAGMVDLEVALRITALARETGASLVWVGDPLQVAPVGHHGAMVMAGEHATAKTELESVHRFRDPDDPTRPDVHYAELSKRVRDATEHTAELTAWELVDDGHVQLAASAEAAQDAMVAAWLSARNRSKSCALVTSTNEEALAINERVQAARLERGQLGQASISGRDGQTLHVGDLVQTRRNDKGTGVENRALWTVTRIHEGGVELESQAVPGKLVTVSAEYADDDVQLAYASTVHGIQGETVDEAVTGPGVDAAGLYVGMTRGKTRNVALVVADDTKKAARELAATMIRGRVESTLTQARRAAGAELAASALETEQTWTPAPWQQRPAGQVPGAELRARHDELVAGLSRTDEQLRLMRDRLDLAQTDLDRYDLEIARDAARRTPSEDSLIRTIPRKMLVDELEEAKRALEGADKTDRDRRREIDALRAEAVIRKHILSPEAAAEEERQRRAAGAPQPRRPRPTQDVHSGRTTPAAPGRGGPSLGI